MSGWLQNEWIGKPCKWCSGKECGGECVSRTETATVDIVVNGSVETKVVEFTTVPPAKSLSRKLTTNEFWCWPEWQAILKRLDLPSGGIQECTITLNAREVMRMSVKTIGGELRCPQHPSGTRPSASGTQEQGETTHTPAPSVDTDDAGTGRQTHG